MVTLILHWLRMLSQTCCRRRSDHDIHANSTERLVVRGRTTEKGNGNRTKSRNSYACKTYNYCGKLGHIIVNY